MGWASGANSLLETIASVAGSIGGVAEACCLQPMDVIKTRLQLDKAKQYTGERHSICKTSMPMLAVAEQPDVA